MNDVISQRLIGLLQPLLDVTLIVKGETSSEETFADLDIVSASALGMGGDVSQGCDAEGNLKIYTSYHTEVAIRYFGLNGVVQLSLLANQLRRISVSEQFQKENIGIGRLENPETVTDIAVDGSPTANAQFRFFIHYTVVVDDTVGVIEQISAAYNGANINLHLTR
jgi:hypothetical protein